MDLIQRCKEKARATPARIVFPEGNDVRILQTARCLMDEEIADVILLGDRSELGQLAHQSALDVSDCEIVDPSTSSNKAGYAERYMMSRPRTRPNVVTRIVTRPLSFGAMMVKSGDADLMVAGVSHTTRRVIEAAAAGIGLADDTSVASSFFIMTFADRPPLIFADCAVNIEPTAEELADIAINSAANAERLLGCSAKVALLSFSTKGSASHALVRKVTDALQIAQKKAPNLAIDGELQVDTALVAGIAAQKIGEPGPVAGAANVLIFPDLQAANIGYKLVKHLAHAQAIGPILQGFSLPVADLSRSAGVDEIVATSIIALAMRD